MVSATEHGAKVASQSTLASIDEAFIGGEFNADEMANSKPFRYGITLFGTAPILHHPVWFGPVTAA